MVAYILNQRQVSRGMVVYNFDCQCGTVIYIGSKADLAVAWLQGGMGAVAGTVVEVTHQLQSLQAARQLCDSLLKVPSPGGSFFQAAVALELAVLPSPSGSLTRLHQLFEVGPYLT